MSRPGSRSFTTGHRDNRRGPLGVVEATLIGRSRPQHAHRLVSDRVGADRSRVGHRIPARDPDTELVTSPNDLTEEPGGDLVPLGVGPHARGEQQSPPGSSDRDVGQTALLIEIAQPLLDPEGRDPFAESLAVGSALHLQHRQPVPVAPQSERNPREPDEPASRGRVRHHPANAVVLRRGRAFAGREGALHEARHCHDVPFQALGSVDGEDLHGLCGRLEGGTFQAALLRDGSIEPGEEADEGGAVGGRGEVGSDVGKGIQVGPRGVGRITRAREHLDVQPERSFGLTDEVRQWQRAEPS